jgi:hypothetical protein
VKENTMGYACYTITRNGQQIEAGYAVDQLCDETGCTEEIDRGLDHLCGETPGDPEQGCGGYFCSKHTYYSITDKSAPQQCARCAGLQDDSLVPDTAVHEPFHQPDRTYLKDSVLERWTAWEMALVALDMRSSAAYQDDPRADEARRIGAKFTADEAARIDAFLASSRQDSSRLASIKSSLAGTGEDGADLRWLVTELHKAWDRLDRLRGGIDHGGSLLDAHMVASSIDYVRWSRQPEAISPSPAAEPVS